MATSKPGQSRISALQRAVSSDWLRVWAVRVGVVLVLCIVAVMALHFSRFGARARLASAYGAHVACSCHFIAGRPLKDCERDFEPGMGLVTLSADEGAHSVTARVIPLASETATFTRGQGCVLESWR